MRPFLLLALLALAGAALAEPIGACDSGGEPALGVVQVTGGSAGTTYYIDDRSYVTGNGLWLYVETNGMWTQKLPGVYLGGAGPDLQRGDQCDTLVWSCTFPDGRSREISRDSESDIQGPDLMVM
jgi:hypothetical protein